MERHFHVAVFISSGSVDLWVQVFWLPGLITYVQIGSRSGSGSKHPSTSFHGVLAFQERCGISRIFLMLD